MEEQVRLEKLVITIGKKSIELTLEEARAVKKVLDDLLEKQTEKTVWITYPYTYPYYPYTYTYPTYTNSVGGSGDVKYKITSSNDGIIYYHT